MASVGEGKAGVAETSVGLLGSGLSMFGKLLDDAGSQVPNCPIVCPSCPRCGGLSAKYERRKNGVLRFRCKKCGLRFQAEYRDLRKEGNPHWKGDKITDGTGRDRAHRWIPVPKGYERHHIDGNPKNNDLSNIRVITRKAHMIEDGRLEKLRSLNAQKRRDSP